LPKQQPSVTAACKAYFITRAIGLDCGPMSGFGNEAVDREFFPGGQIKSNFICAIGYGDPAGLLERLPRPDINEVCSFV
jgi:nitroreductase